MSVPKQYTRAELAHKNAYDKGYQQGIEDERPKSFVKGYDSGYQQGKQEKCDKCDYFISVEEAYKQSRADERNNIGIFLRRRNLYALEREYEKWLKEQKNE